MEPSVALSRGEKPAAPLAHDGRATAALGLGVILFAVLLWFVAIPHGITTPGNVRRIVLSPTFWPRIIATATLLVGLGLLAQGLAASRAARRAHRADRAVGRRAATVRLGLLASVMAAYVLAIPVAGMVWASIPAYVATAFLVRSAHPIAVCVVALLLPLGLYVFFAKGAGVAIPQGVFLRLP